MCVCVLSHVCLFAPHELYSLPGSFVHGIFQVRILEWVAISFSKVLTNPGIKLTSGSPALAGGFLATVPPEKCEGLLVVAYT